MSENELLKKVEEYQTALNSVVLAETHTTSTNLKLRKSKRN